MSLVNEKPTAEFFNIEWGDESQAQISILLSAPVEAARRVSEWTLVSTDSPTEPLNARALMKL